jgi:carbonic anhydrase
MLTLSVTQAALRSSGLTCSISHPDPISSKEALRSIVISQRLLGTREIAVFHHTGCGMLTFSTPQLRNIVKEAHPGDEEVAKHVDAIDFLEFPHLEESVKSDVKLLEEHPLVLKETKVTGWVYEVETGKVSLSFKVLVLIANILLAYRSGKSCRISNMVVQDVL